VILGVSLFLVGIEQPQQKDTIPVSTPICDGPCDKPNADNKSKEAFGPKHGKHKHPSRREITGGGDSYGVRKVENRDENETVTEKSENSSTKRKPAQSGPPALFLSETLYPLLFLRRQLHSHPLSKTAPIFAMLSLSSARSRMIRGAKKGLHLNDP
jgi:hypothetical protein